MCKASIIIPAYNAANYIAKTIDSILNQAFHDFECIIVDDGSEDNTREIIRSYQDRRIKLIEQPNSGGPAQPRNRGIAHAQGDYLFLFDSDDTMVPEKLSTYMAIFTNRPDVDFLFSDFAVIDADDRVTAARFLSIYQDFRTLCRPVTDDLYQVDSRFFVRQIVNANFIGTSSVAFKRSCVTSDHLFEESVRNGDDLLAWVKLSKQVSMYFIDRVLHSYRDRDGSISRAGTDRLLQNKLLVLEKMKTIAPEASVEIHHKINRCLFSLGYFYFKKKRYHDALSTYSKVSGYAFAIQKYRVMAKVLMAQLFGL